MTQVLTRRRLRLIYFRNYCSNRRRLSFELLKISSTSSEKEIREAFLKLAKKNHPDITGKRNHEEFLKINEAYNILKKKNSMKEYDQLMNMRHTRRKNYYESYYQGYEEPYIFRGKSKSVNGGDKVKEDNKLSIHFLCAFFIGIICIIAFEINLIKKNKEKKKHLKMYMESLSERRYKALHSNDKNG